jgi:hypothetical protein
MLRIFICIQDEYNGTYSRRVTFSFRAGNYLFWKPVNSDLWNIDAALTIRRRYRRQWSLQKKVLRP